MTARRACRPLTGAGRTSVGRAVRKLLSQLILSSPAAAGFGIAGSFLGGIVGRLVHLSNRAGLLASVAGTALLIWFFRRRKASAASTSSIGK